MKNLLGWRTQRIEALLVSSLLLLGAFIYSYNAFSSFYDGDEGNYLYAAWRISVGEVPYRDFLTPQMPLFLYWGGLIVRLFGRSYVALRLATMLVTLLAAYLLYALNRELYGPPVALLSMALFLVEANVFYNARFFRSEAYMLLFSLAGLYTFVWGERRGQGWTIGLASVFFGLAILSKLFGFLPLAGCMLYLLYAWRREGRPFQEVLCEGLVLGIPAVLVVVVVAAIFGRVAPYFITAVIEHHVMQGANLSHWEAIVKALLLYQSYVVGQPVVVGLAVLGVMAVLRRSLVLQRGKAIQTLALWQVPTVLAFMLLTRPLMLRHLAYLAPAITTLVALALWRLLQGCWQMWKPDVGIGERSQTQRWAWGIVTLATSIAAVSPWAVASMRYVPLKDNDSFALADFVRELTAPDDYVIADRGKTSFLAGRRTTYWAAGISGAAAASGQIRGEMLIAEMEKRNVVMVILCDTCQYIANLEDSSALWRYVQAHYALIDKPSRGDHVVYVYTRRDMIPYKLDIAFHDELALTGMRLGQGEVAGGDSLSVLLRWQALKEMASDYEASLRLVDASGLPWAQTKGVPIEGIGRSTSNWEPKQVELQEHGLKVAPGTPPGSYYLTVQVYEPNTGQTLQPVGGGKSMLSTGEAVIASVRVLPAAMPPRPETLSMAVEIDANLAEGLELVGSRSLPRGMVAGRALNLALFWYAPARPPQDYRLEFRLERGEQVAQRWGEEIAAEYPTSAWREGEVVFGRYRLKVAEGLVEGHHVPRRW